MQRFVPQNIGFSSITRNEYTLTNIINYKESLFVSMLHFYDTTQPIINKFWTHVIRGKEKYIGYLSCRKKVLYPRDRRKPTCELECEYTCEWVSSTRVHMRVYVRGGMWVHMRVCVRAQLCEWDGSLRLDVRVGVDV